MKGRQKNINCPTLEKPPLEKDRGNTIASYMDYMSIFLSINLGINVKDFWLFWPGHSINRILDCITSKEKKGAPVVTSLALWVSIKKETLWFCSVIRVVTKYNHEWGVDNSNSKLQNLFHYHLLTPIHPKWEGTRNSVLTKQKKPPFLGVSFNTWTTHFSGIQNFESKFFSTKHGKTP